MASINIHYTYRDVKPNPDIEVSRLEATGSHVIRISEPGNDSIALFFEDRDEIINFVDKVNTALTAFLQANERGGE